MTDDAKPIKKGRGHPPVEHQWPPGVSGNIFGRPVGSKNKLNRHGPGLTASQQIALEEATRPVKTSDGQMPALRAVNRAQFVAALKGGSNAQRNFLDRIEKIQAKQAVEQQALLLQYEEYKQIYEMHKEIATKRELAIIYDNLLPHPEDVEVDFEKGTVVIHGPSSTRQRKYMSQALAALAQIRALVFELRRDVAAHPSDRGLHYLLADCTDRFMRKNDRLPERYRLKRLPIWKRGADIPIPA